MKSIPGWKTFSQILYVSFKIKILFQSSTFLTTLEFLLGKIIFAQRPDFKGQYLIVTATLEFHNFALPLAGSNLI